jgi:O-acetyl-ADP-ribose deacetylase
MSSIKETYALTNSTRLEIAQGDLTSEAVDAIVNAANDRLAHGGGVALAIVQAGGEVIQEESSAWVAQHGLVKHASPAYTSGGQMPCRYVIHAVGPIWGEGEEDRKLEEAVTGSLELAEVLGAEKYCLPGHFHRDLRLSQRPGGAGVFADYYQLFQPEARIEPGSGAHYLAR